MSINTLHKGDDDDDNNNNNKLQLRCHPVAVVILHGELFAKFLPDYFGSILSVFFY
jgi:mannosyltransferase OCH1-like enzyme